MNKVYTAELLPGNHGIWLFVKQNGIVIFEQAGLKTVEDALDFAKGVILSKESLELPLNDIDIDSGN